MKGFRRNVLKCFQKYTQKYFSTSNNNNINACIIGTGPSGFYTAKYLLKKNTNNNINITFFESLPTPFGLARFGVAPDHADTKNCINDFTKILNENNVKVFLFCLEFSMRLQKRWIDMLHTYVF